METFNDAAITMYGGPERTYSLSCCLCTLQSHGQTDLCVRC